MRARKLSIFWSPYDWNQYNNQANCAIKAMTTATKSQGADGPEGLRGNHKCVVTTKADLNQEGINKGTVLSNNGSVPPL